MRAAMTRPLALIAALLSVSASTVYAADSCGGGCPKLPKTSRSVSATIPALPTTSSSPAILSAGLAKGKPKRVLHVEATITSGPIGWASASTLFMVAYTNGNLMQPGINTASAPSQSCAANSACSLTASYWLDLDAFPSLIGVPITVDLIGVQTNGAAGTATMTVRMDKK